MIMYFLRDSYKDTSLKLATGKGLFCQKRGFSLCLQLLLKSQLHSPRLRHPDLHVHPCFTSPTSCPAQEMASHGQPAGARSGQRKAGSNSPILLSHGKVSRLGDNPPPSIPRSRHPHSVRPSLKPPGTAPCLDRLQPPDYPYSNNTRSKDGDLPLGSLPASE